MEYTIFGYRGELERSVFRIADVASTFVRFDLGKNDYLYIIKSKSFKLNRLKCHKR